MKEFRLLSDDQVLKLNESDLQKYINLECAKAGIKILLKPEKPLLHEIPAAKTEQYNIENVGNIAFKSEESAKEVRDLLESLLEKGELTNYDYFTGGSYIRVEDEHKGEFEIKRRLIHSRDNKKEIEKLVKENEKLESTYKELKKEFDAVEAEKEPIVSEIMNRYNSLVEEKYNNDLHVDRFKRDYLALAEYNTAIGFYKKAYSISDKTEAYIKENATDKK